MEAFEKRKDFTILRLTVDFFLLIVATFPDFGSQERIQSRRLENVCVFKIQFDANRFVYYFLRDNERDLTVNIRIHNLIHVLKIVTAKTNNGIRFST